MTAPPAHHPHLTHEVYGMADDEFLVRGTLDPMQALRLVVDELGYDIESAGMLYGTSRETFPSGERMYGELDLDAVKALGDHLHEMLGLARPGLYRKNPVAPGSLGEYEGWRWQLGYGKTKGHGTFEGVYFRAW